MTSMKSLSVRVPGALGIAALALSFSFGGSYGVRAQDHESPASPLQEMVAPIMRAVDGLGQQLASLEASVAALATSFTSQHITTQQLCIADDTGGRTCVTKEQLDALLRLYAHAEAEQPAASVSASNAHAEAVDIAMASGAAEFATRIAEENVENADEEGLEPAQTETIIATTAAEVADETVEDDQQSAQSETVITTASAATSVADETIAAAAQPAPTETEISASSGAALIWYPEVEISTAVPAASSD